MIVVDASFVFEWIFRTPNALAAFDAHGIPKKACAPEVLDLEILQTLRRHLREGLVSNSQANHAIDMLAESPIERKPHGSIISRIWELRDNLSAYDSSYVALAEDHNIPLWTRDARITKAPGLRAKIILV